ncbi:hypothetical protein ACTFIW_007628 [Dictyostelium discoideum]
MSSYAEIAKTIQSDQTTHHYIDDESKRFIDDFKTNSHDLDNIFDQIKASTRGIDKFCELLNDASLNSYQRNNGHFTITFEFPNASESDLELKRIELSKHNIPIENLFTSKRKKKSIHALIKEESTLINILRNRNKIGPFYTSSKDYHVITGIVKIDKDNADTVNQLLRTATKINIPYAFYHSEYNNDNLSIFGLIEYKKGDKVAYLKSKTSNMKFTLKRASRALYYDKIIKKSSEYISIKSNESQNQPPSTSGSKNENKKVKYNNSKTSKSINENQIEVPNKDHSKQNEKQTINSNNDKTNTNNKLSEINDIIPITNLNDSFTNLSVDESEEPGQNSAKLYLSPIRETKIHNQDPSATQQ